MIGSPAQKQPLQVLFSLLSCSLKLNKKQTLLNSLSADFDWVWMFSSAGGTTTLVDLVMPERGDSLVEAFNMWKESGEEAACCDFALAVAVPQMDEQTRCA